jgi:hypothetical protein
MRGAGRDVAGTEARGSLQPVRSRTRRSRMAFGIDAVKPGPGY